MKGAFEKGFHSPVSKHPLLVKGINSTGIDFQGGSSNAAFKPEL